MISIVIEGKPMAKQRYRFKVIRAPKAKAAYLAGRTKSLLARYGLMHMTYDPQQEIVDQTALLIKRQYHSAPILGAVSLQAWFYMPIPKRTSLKRTSAKLAGIIFHTKKPDLTNMEKFYEDCMSGIVFKDDRQIVRKASFKEFSTRPRVELYIKQL